MFKRAQLFLIRPILLADVATVTKILSIAFIYILVRRPNFSSKNPLSNTFYLLSYLQRFIYLFSLRAFRFSARLVGSYRLSASLAACALVLVMVGSSLPVIPFFECPITTKKTYRNLGWRYPL